MGISSNVYFMISRCEIFGLSKFAITATNNKITEALLRINPFNSTPVAGMGSARKLNISMAHKWMIGIISFSLIATTLGISMPLHIQSILLIALGCFLIYHNWRVCGLEQHIARERFSHILNGLKQGKELSQCHNNNAELMQQLAQMKRRNHDIQAVTTQLAAIHTQQQQANTELISLERTDEQQIIIAQNRLLHLEAQATELEEQREDNKRLAQRVIQMTSQQEELTAELARMHAEEEKLKKEVDAILMHLNKESSRLTALPTTSAAIPPRQTLD